MSKLSATEIETLTVISGEISNYQIARKHLEKLSRLNLIEPTTSGITLSLKGKQYLFRRK